MICITNNINFQRVIYGQFRHSQNIACSRVWSTKTHSPTAGLQCRHA